VTDGKNAVFTTGVALKRIQVWKNGILQTIGVDVSTVPLAILFLPASIPGPGDIITALGW
jgi:hypothetical protein